MSSVDGSAAGGIGRPAASLRPERLLTGRFWLVVASGTAYFLAIGMVLPVLPLYVERRLGGSSLAVGVVVGAFAFGAIALRPVAGRLGDEVGRRILIAGGAAVAGGSTLLYTLAHGTLPLLGLRVLTGVGEAAFFVGASTMITDLAPAHRRGEALSYWSVAVYGGLAFGPALGEMILAGGRYEAVWTVAGLSALLAAVLGLGTVDTLAAAPGRRPWRRGSGATGGPHGEPAGPAPAHDAPGRAKLLHRGALRPGSVMFLGLVGLAGFATFVPLYAREVGMDDARMVFLLYGGLILAVRVLGARLPDVLGPRLGGTLALATGAAGLALMALWSSAAGLFAGTAVFALGMSLLYPALTTLALDGVPDRERASAMGTVSTFFDLSQGVGPFALGAVVGLASYRVMFGVGALFSVLGLVLLRGQVTRAAAPSVAGAEPGSESGPATGVGPAAGAPAL